MDCAVAGRLKTFEGEEGGGEGVESVTGLRGVVRARASLERAKIHGNPSPIVSQTIKRHPWKHLFQILRILESSAPFFSFLEGFLSADGKKVRPCEK